MACLRWDLDALAASTGDCWHLLEGPAKVSEASTEGGAVAAQCHALPHRVRLKPSEHDLAAEPFRILFTWVASMPRSRRWFTNLLGHMDLAEVLSSGHAPQRLARHLQAGVMQTSQNVVTLQFRVIGQDFIPAHARVNEVEDDLYRPAQMAVAGFTMANIWDEGNTA